jgi:hypothetical protein
VKTLGVFPRYPLLYQINTRVWLRQLSVEIGRPATLDEVPDKALDHLAELGFDWVWLLGVWSLSPMGREVALQIPEWVEAYRSALPDFSYDDVCGSCFAIAGYTVDPGLGGEAALARFRTRLMARGVRLMLDFIPNHTGRDHPWVSSSPEYYIEGSPEDLTLRPDYYGEAPSDSRVLAFGRDPYFPGWSDTFQLNYGNPDLQEAMRLELSKIARQCDGVRCDMAMLILPQVFQRTWGIEMEPFWPAAIRSIRQETPAFTFMAEVYWDLEWTLQQQGFDFAYDKRLYDRLRYREARGVREHFFAGLDYQRKLARFLENHDEPRAPEVFPEEVHQAAAVVTFLSPGLRFFHQGQLEGRRVHLPVQLCRGSDEAAEPGIEDFYRRLLQVLKRRIVREGDWQLLEPHPAWTGNWTSDNFIVFAWSGGAEAGARQRGNDSTLESASAVLYLLIAVNYASHQSQCYVRLPFPGFEGRTVHLQDCLSETSYDVQGADLLGRGLYLDLPPWGYHVFDMAIRG